jgi:hypothetical protein
LGFHPESALLKVSRAAVKTNQAHQAKKDEAAQQQSTRSAQGDGQYQPVVGESQAKPNEEQELAYRQRPGEPSRSVHLTTDFEQSVPGRFQGIMFG